MKEDKDYCIQIDNLNYNFEDKNILKNINIKFKKNKFYSIIGPNGSGKTTFLKSLSKLLDPPKNSVFIDKTDINKLKSKQLARKLSLVPQNTMLDFDFSSLDIVLMGRSPYIDRFHSESKADLQIAENAMKLTNTWMLKDKNINSLSGGEQQRVLIARSIAQDTDILLLDEPISHLDIYHQVEFLDTLKFLNKSITVIAVLHDLNLAAQYSDYLILVHKGNIVASGSPEEVLTKKNIKEVYNMDVCLLENPMTGSPHIIPISKNSTSHKIKLRMK